MRRLLLVAASLAVLAPLAAGEVAVEVRAEKKVYAPGEPVRVVVVVRALGVCPRCRRAAVVKTESGWTCTSAHSGCNTPWEAGNTQIEGQKPQSYTLPTDVPAGLSIFKLSPEGKKPEPLVQGQPVAGNGAKDLPVGELLVSEAIDVSAKLSGEGEYEFGWKSADGIVAKLGTCAVWMPETLAALKDTVAVIETNHGKVCAEFFPEVAPVTVQNFLYLARRGFYSKLTFHRVIAGFMMQGGCPAGNGTADAGYKLAGEFSDRKHVRGILSMARSGNPDTGGSQFYVCFGDAAWLDTGYSAFGKVLWGFDTMDVIEKVKTDHHTMGGKCGKNHRDMPLDDVKILGVTIGTRAELGAEPGKGG